jgi:excisionase family DNA binding protein
MSKPADAISAKVAARILGCHPSTVYRLVASGQLPSWSRHGSRLFIVSRADVEALIERVREPVQDSQTSPQTWSESDFTVGSEIGDSPLPEKAAVPSDSIEP